MNNFERSVEATNTAMNSQGSGFRENEQYLNSLVAKLNKVKNAWTELAINAGDALLSDGVVAFSEGMSSLISGSSGAVKSIGLLPPIIGLVSVAIATMSNGMRTAVLEKAKASTATNGLSGAYNRLAASASLAGGATRTLAVILRSIPQIAVFMGIGIALEKIVSSIVKTKKEQEEFNKIMAISTQSLETNKDNVDSLIESYKKLDEAKQVDKLTVQQNEEYVKVQNDLAQLLPSLVVGEDAKGNSILISSQYLEQYVELLRERVKLEADQTRNSASKNIKTTLNERGLIESDIEVNARQMETVQRRLDGKLTKGQRTHYMNEVIDLEKRRIELQQELLTNQSKISDEYKNLLNNVENLNQEDFNFFASTSDHSESAIADIQKFAKEVSKVREATGDMFSTEEIKGFNEDQIGVLDSMSVALKNGHDDWEQWRGVIDGVGLNADKVISHVINKMKEQADAQKKFNKGVEEGIFFLDEMGNVPVTPDTNLDEVEELFVKVNGEIIKYVEGMDLATGAVGSLNEAQQKLTDQFNSAISSIETLNGFLNELNEGHQLSAKSMATIMEKYPDLLGYMNDEVALIEQIKIKLQEEEQIAKQVVYNKIKDNEHFFREVLKGNNHLIKELSDFYGVDLSNFKSLAEAKGAIEIALMSKLSKEWSKYYNASTQSLTQQGRDLEQGIKDGRYAGGEAYALRGAIESARAQARSVESLFKDISFESFNVDFKGIGLKSPSSSSGSSPKSGSSSSTKADEPNTKDRIDSLIREFNTRHQLIALENDEVKSKIDLAKSQDDYNKQLELTNHLISGQKSQINELKFANIQLHTKANQLRNDSNFDTSTWFDHNNLATTSYEELYNKSTKLQQEEMDTLFSKLQRLKNAYGSNVEEVNKLTQTNNELTNSLSSLSLEYQTVKFTRALSDLQYHMQISKDAMSLMSDESEQYTTELIRQNAILEEKVALTDTEIERLVKLLSTMQRGTKEYQDTEKIIRDLVLTVNQYNRELLELQKTTQDHARKKLDSISSTEQKIIEMIRHRVQVEKDALRETLSAYEKYMNDKINILRKEADEEDYNKQLTKEQEELMKLQTLLNEQLLDDSLSSRNKQRELRESIATQEEKIAEMQRKKALDNQIDNLQQLIESERERTDEKDKELDKQLNNDKLYAEARKAIETGHLRWLVRETDGTYRQVNGIVTTTMISLKDAYVDFENAYGQGLSALGEQIKNEFVDKIIEAQEEIKNLADLMKQINMDIGDFEPSGKYNSQSKLGEGQVKTDNMNLLWAKFVNDELMTNADIKSNGNSVSALASMRDTITGSFINDRSQTLDPNNTQNFNQLYSTLSATEKQELIDFLKQQLLGGRIHDPKNVKVVENILKNLPMFASGGMTGRWGGNGAKLAGLHPEEIILSKTDTNKFKELMDKLHLAHKNITHNLTPMSPSFSGVGMKQQSVEFKIGNLIGNVEGNLDKSVLPNLEKMIDGKFEKLGRQFNKMGFSKRV